MAVGVHIPGSDETIELQQQVARLQALLEASQHLALEVDEGHDHHGHHQDNELETQERIRPDVEVYSENAPGKRRRHEWNTSTASPSGSTNIT